MGASGEVMVGVSEEVMVGASEEVMVGASGELMVGVSGGNREVFLYIWVMIYGNRWLFVQDWKSVTVLGSCLL